MLNVNDIWNRVNLLIGKDQYGKVLTPLRYNQILKWMPQRLTDKYLQEFEETRVISNNLRHLFKTAGTPETPYLSVDAFGRVRLPDDFYYPSSGYTSAFLNECGSFSEIRNNIEFVDDATFGERTSGGEAAMLYPTKDYPIAKYTNIFENDEYVQAMLIAPIVSKISFTYIRETKTPVFAYTVSSGTIIYDAANSVQLDFPDSALDDAVEMIVQDIARMLHSQEDYQPSQIQEAKQS